MKTNLHPTWYNDCTVTCSCGNKFVTGATKPSLQVDMCSACHPFFTGEMRYVDVQGRVEKFQAKWQKAKTYRESAKSKKAKPEKAKPVKSLKEMLTDLKTQQAVTVPAAVNN